MTSARLRVRMRRFVLGVACATTLLAAAMLATLPVPSFGAALWHHNAAFAALALGAAACAAQLRRRPVATLAMAFLGTAATVTGFAMLYTKQFAYKEWLTWWHTVTSVAFALAFLFHWSRNNPRLVDLARKLFAPRAPGLAAAGAWTAVAAGALWTGTPGGRARFTADNYLGLSSWTIVAGVAFAYGLWLAFRLPALRTRLARRAVREKTRGLVDTGLFLANWGMLLTGLALLWLATPLRAGDLKYVSKWWHTATSVLFLGLLALHVGFNARLLARHARTVSGEGF